MLHKYLNMIYAMLSFIYIIEYVEDMLLCETRVLSKIQLNLDLKTIIFFDKFQHKKHKYKLQTKDLIQEISNLKLIIKRYLKKRNKFKSTFKSTKKKVKR